MNVSRGIREVFTCPLPLSPLQARREEIQRGHQLKGRIPRSKLSEQMSPEDVQS